MSKEAGSGKIIHVTTLADLHEDELERKVRAFNDSLISILEQHTPEYGLGSTGNRLSTGEVQKEITDKVRAHFFSSIEEKF